MRRIRELDGLRAVAILGVLATHLVPQNIPPANLARLGWTGVDLFFAISGFLITGILIGLRGTEASFRTFYWRRTLRIVPPYYIALLLTLGLAVWHDEKVDYRAVFHHALFLSSAKPAILQSAVVRLFSHVPVPPSQSRPAHNSLPLFANSFEVYWSLSVEELFYLLWAPIMLKGSRRLVIICATAPMLICPLLRGLAHVTPHLEESLGFVFRFDSLAAGACIALLFWEIENGRIKTRIVDRGLIATMAISSLGLIVLTPYCGALRGIDVRTTLPFSVLGYSLLAGLCSSLVGLCACWKGRIGVLSSALGCRTSVYLGTVSYTLYLTHLPIYVLTGLVFVRCFSRDPTTGGSAVAIVCSIVATMAAISVAGLSWKYFETPILRLKDRYFPLKPMSQAVPLKGTLDQADRVCV